VLKAHQENAQIGEEEQKPLMNQTGLKVGVTRGEVAIGG
jgi:hypothetical protein